VCFELRGDGGGHVWWVGGLCNPDVAPFHAELSMVKPGVASNLGKVTLIGMDAFPEDKSEW
jgi:hypothetical protein